MELLAVHFLIQCRSCEIFLVRKFPILKIHPCCSKILMGIHQLTWEHKCHKIQTRPSVFKKSEFDNQFPWIHLFFYIGWQWVMDEKSQKRLSASPVIFFFPISNESNHAPIVLNLWGTREVQFNIPLQWFQLKLCQLQVKESWHVCLLFLIHSWGFGVLFIETHVSPGRPL